jgi:hypothetical protein
MTFYEPEKGGLIGKGEFLSKIAQTSRSDIWELVSSKNKKLLVKLTNPSLYPSIMELIEKNKKSENITEELKKVEVDYVNNKKIPSFSHRPRLWDLGYSSYYGKVYLIMDRFESSIINYPGSPQTFLYDMIAMLKELHLLFYTSNNISSQDVLYNTQEDGSFKLYLVDFKNLTRFNDSIRQDLSLQGNAFLSLKLVTMAASNVPVVPSIFDDIESALYLYCVVSKINFPYFTNQDFETQIIAKTSLDFLPNSIRDVILYFREMDKLNFIPDDNFKLVKSLYEEGIEPIIQQLINLGPLTVTSNLPMAPPKDYKQSPSRIALYEAIRLQIISWGQINSEYVDTFSQKVVNFLLDGEEPEPTVMNQIYDFLQISE